MGLKLPLIYVHYVDIIGSAAMLALAIWIFYEAFKLRRLSFFHLYLFLLSCSLGTFAVSRASGHILRNIFLYRGDAHVWHILSAISGGANTLIFVIIASLSFYYGIFRNLQETRDRERESYVKDLQGTRDFLQKVVDSLNTELVVIDQLYRIVMVNKKFMDDFRMTGDEVLGMPCYEILHRYCETVTDCRKDDEEDHFCPWKRIRERREPVLMTHIHSLPGTGESRHVEISASPVFGSNGEADYVIETLTDITDKVKMEEMKRAQEKLRGVVEMASAVAHELNTPMFAVLGNAQLLKRSLEAKDPVQREMDTIIRNVKRMSGLTKQMARITEYTTKDYVDGEKLVDIVAASEVRGESVDQEQRERAEREERWYQLEKMAAVGELTAGVAHELNNALNIVLGYSQLLLREFPSGSRTRYDLEKIEKNAKQCQRIASGLLDYTRSMARKKEYHDVNSHLEETLNLVENRLSLDGIRIVREFAADIEAVMMDANEMKQVYLNLLNNAAQAIGKNGEIVVKTEFDGVRKEAVVSISDSGPGISPHLMEKIFSPFFTTKMEGSGTGLGLNVSRAIVHNHGGSLEARNRPEGGATFAIRLPLEREE